jgi:hypothetical protein
LITTGIVRQHWQVAAALAATPAARQLSVQQVTQLLCTCIHLEPVRMQLAEQDGSDSDSSDDAEEPDRYRPSSCFAALCKARAASSVSAAGLARLLRLAVMQQQYERAQQLCCLCSARQLSWQHLSELLLVLLPCKSGAEEEEEDEEQYEDFQQEQLTGQLLLLPAANHLAPGAACQLFAGLLRKSTSNDLWLAEEETYDDWRGNILWGFAKQLTAGDMMQLPAAAKAGCSAAVWFFASTDAAEGIDDAEAFAAFLQAALVCGITDAVMEAAVQDLPVVQQLQPPAVLGILQGWIRNSTCQSASLMYDFLVHHEALEGISLDAVQELLLLAVQQQRLAAVSGLLLAPAAEQLSVAVVEELLLHAVQEQSVWRDNSNTAADSLLVSLLDLSVVEQLPPAAFVNVLAAAVEAGNCDAVELLCELSAAEQISTAAAANVLQQAAQQGYAMSLAVLRGLSQLADAAAGLAQLAPRQLQRFLFAAVTAGDSDGLQQLCQYILAAEAAEGAAAATGAAIGAATGAAISISSRDMQDLLSLALVQTRAMKASITAEAAAQLFKLSVAKALGSAAAAVLMTACVQKLDAAGLKLVGQLPAAAQLDQQCAEALVLEVLTYSYGSRHASNKWRFRKQMLLALLEQAAVQRLGPDSALRLMSASVEKQKHQELLLLHSRLPAAQQCAEQGEAVRQLLLLAFEMQQWESFDWLVGLPAAPVHDDDEEVVMWRALRACQSEQCCKAL